MAQNGACLLDETVASGHEALHLLRMEGQSPRMLAGTSSSPSNPRSQLVPRCGRSALGVLVAAAAFVIVAVLYNHYPQGTAARAHVQGSVQENSEEIGGLPSILDACHIPLMLSEDDKEKQGLQMEVCKLIIQSSLRTLTFSNLLNSSKKTDLERAWKKLTSSIYSDEEKGAETEGSSFSVTAIRASLMDFMDDTDAFFDLGPGNNSSDALMEPTAGFSYDDSLASECWKFSTAAYCPPEKLRAHDFQYSSCKRLFNNLDIKTFKVDRKDSQSAAYVALDKDRQRIVVAFKGTNESLQECVLHAFDGCPDWKHDIFGTSASAQGGECKIEGVLLPGSIHPGFCEYYQDLVNIGFAKYLNQTVADNPDFELLYTGHSLGASLASIAAADGRYRQKFKAKASLKYTFGEPRTGNYEFASYVAGQLDATFRLTNQRDIVPHFPPCLMKPGCVTMAACWYDDACSTWSTWSHHAGTEHFNRPDGAVNYQKCNGYGEDPKCSFGYAAISADDHHDYMDNTWCCG